MLTSFSSLSRFSTEPGWWPECISFAASAQEVRAAAPGSLLTAESCLLLEALAFPPLSPAHPWGTALPLPASVLHVVSLSDVCFHPLCILRFPGQTPGSRHWRPWEFQPMRVGAQEGAGVASWLRSQLGVRPSCVGISFLSLNCEWLGRATVRASSVKGHSNRTHWTCCPEDRSLGRPFRFQFWNQGGLALPAASCASLSFPVCQKRVITAPPSPPHPQTHT